MDIICLQTADPDAYYDMLCDTSQTVRLYCQENGIRYQCFIGIKRGYFNWHASFNRIYMIKEVLDSGFRGWILYLDADAYIANLKFDLKNYLKDKGEYAILVRPGSFNGNFWDINIGVMLINSNASCTRWLIDQWLSAFLRVPDETLRSASGWGVIPHDQELLEKILWDNPDLEPHFFKDLTQTLHSGPERGGSAFIEQVIRAVTGDEQERRWIIRRNVVEALRSYGREIDPELTASRDQYRMEAGKIVTGLYEGLLERPPDEHGLAVYTEALTRSGVAYVVRDMVAGDEFQSRFNTFRNQDSTERSSLWHRAASRVRVPRLGRRRTGA